ncbi:hypothetical protein [Pseudomonas sp. RIT-PI-AD]|uniref:hypothetical protein n=1 Tax=Pseudomonas sp. RIT-PI-AD TaxID=3035294 RepID=UPI0021D88B89|nr:hypothetical protein [Pseudomonas sp. RIT-PI-AD]
MNETLAQNPYSVPSSELQDLPSPSQVPTIEEALSRGYDFRIGALIGESWRRVKGTKGIIFGGFIVMYVVAFILMNLLSTVLVFTGVAGLAAMQALTQGAGLGMGVVAMGFGFMLMMTLGMALCYPFFAGIFMVGIRRAADQPVSFNEIFSHFRRSVPVIVTALLVTLLSSIGYMLFVIPGLYLSIAYILAIPLVVERGLSPWQAMEASRKAIGQHWFKVFGLLLVLTLLMSLSSLPLGIGLIWTLPLTTIALGVLYRTVFGVLPAPR